MIIAIIGASASGKDYLYEHLKDEGCYPLVSDTTRKPRPGEREGINYYYKDINEFKQNLKNNQYVEYDEYSEGRFYGLSKTELDKAIASPDKDQVIVVTPNGYRAIKNYVGKNNIFAVYMTASVGDRAMRYIKRMGIENVKIEDINEMTRRINCDYGMFLGFEKEADICIDNSKNNDIMKSISMIYNKIDEKYNNYENER